MQPSKRNQPNALGYNHKVDFGDFEKKKKPYFCTNHQSIPSSRIKTLQVSRHFKSTEMLVKHCGILAHAQYDRPQIFCMTYFSLPAGS